MSHTPGPWSVAENLFGNTASYEVYSNAKTKSGKGGYTRICQVTPRDQKANASLIAAAPDLLEALEAAKQFISNGIELGYINMPEKGDTANDTLGIIDEALTLREGRRNGDGGGDGQGVNKI